MSASATLHSAVSFQRTHCATHSVHVRVHAQSCLASRLEALSRVLRHTAETHGLAIRRDGFCQLSAAGSHCGVTAACFFFFWLTPRTKGSGESYIFVSLPFKAVFIVVHEFEKSLVKDILALPEFVALGCAKDDIQVGPGLSRASARSAVADAVLSSSETQHGLSGTGRMQRKEAKRDEDRTPPGRLTELGRRPAPLQQVYRGQPNDCLL